MHRVTSIFDHLDLNYSSIAFAQTQIEVSLTTDGPVGLAPAFAAFHDGTYDIFDVGSMSSPGLELLAELGDASTLLATAPAGVNVRVSLLAVRFCQLAGTRDPPNFRWMERRHHFLWRR